MVLWILGRVCLYVARDRDRDRDIDTYFILSVYPDIPTLQDPGSYSRGGIEVRW